MREQFSIDIDFVGGNLVVLDIDGDQVRVARDLRDTDKQNWFYWAFRVRNAGGRTLRFRFEGPPCVGFYGAAVSHDLRDWHWQGERVDARGFDYTFQEDENEVFFAHHMLYHPDRFFAFADAHGLRVDTLCESRQGRAVPMVEFGEGDSVILLTARHHCCESTGNYVLEGVLEGLPKGHRVMCVPFVDYDGVLAGDQGKNRIPHDHARDYTDAPIYPSVAAIMDYARQNRVVYGFDFHSPYHSGNGNDFVYMIKKFAEKLDDLNRFGDLFAAAVGEDSMPYRREWDYEPGCEWNDPDIPNFACFLHKGGAALTFTLETTYFGRPGVVQFTEKGALALGRAFAEAIRGYIGK